MFSFQVAPTEGRAHRKSDVVLASREQVGEQMGIHPVRRETEGHSLREVDIEPASYAKEQSRVGLMRTWNRGSQNGQQHTQLRRQGDVRSLVNSAEARPRE